MKQADEKQADDKADKEVKVGDLKQEDMLRQSWKIDEIEESQDKGKEND